MRSADRDAPEDRRGQAAGGRPEAGVAATGKSTGPHRRGSGRRGSTAIVSTAEDATLDVVEISQGTASMFLLAPVLAGIGLDLPRDCMFIMDLRADVRGGGPAEGAFLLYDGAEAVLSGRAVSAVRQGSRLEVRFGDLAGPLADAFGRQAGLSLTSEALSDTSLSPGSAAAACRSNPATLRLVPGDGKAAPATESGQSALTALAGLLGLELRDDEAEASADPGMGDLARMAFPRYFLAS